MLANEVISKGVTAGSGLFVGGGAHPNESGPATIESGTCYFGYSGTSYILNGCVYLVDQSGKFEWIPSSNGAVEKGAVKYNDVPVGRVLHGKAAMRIGKISKTQQCILYPYLDKELKAASYEALVFKPHRL
jgi:Protein of unknown function (DUF3421)